MVLKEESYYSLMPLESLNSLFSSRINFYTSGSKKEMAMNFLIHNQRFISAVKTPILWSKIMKVIISSRS